MSTKVYDEQKRIAMQFVRECKNSKDLEFNYTPVDDSLQYCELWGNWSGWHLNDSQLSLSEIVNTFNKTSNSNKINFQSTSFLKFNLRIVSY